MNSEPAQKRPLSSLMPEECQALFALAFGYGVHEDLLTGFSLTSYFPTDLQHTAPFTLGDNKTRLVIFPDGDITACRDEEDGKEPARFNAFKVVGYLQSLNIAFGPEQPPKRVLSDLTVAEGYVLFCAAFGRAPLDDIIVSVWEMKTCITISDGHVMLTLSEQGQATVHQPPLNREEQAMWPSINAQRLIEQLNGLKIQFGSQLTGVGA